MKKATSRTLTEAQKADLDALEADDQVDTSDLPGIVNWPDARRGLICRPVKKQITLRLDVGVLAWFKKRTPDGRGYQTEINRALRQSTLNATDGERELGAMAHGGDRLAGGAAGSGRDGRDAGQALQV